MAEKQLNPQRMGLLTARCRIRVVDAEAGTTIEQIADPSWWAHVAQTLEPWDEIWIREESGAWYCKVLVRSAGRVTAEVELLSAHDFTKTKIGAPYQGEDTGCVVEWAGPHHKWRVRRGLEVIKTGCQSKKQAEAWVVDYMKALAA